MVWCPFPSEEEAVSVIGQLLEEKLIACGNIMPVMLSVFVWEGRQQTAREAGALMKTTVAKLDHAIARVAELHSYETPAVVGWRCDGAAPETLSWLGELG